MYSRLQHIYSPNFIFPDKHNFWLNFGVSHLIISIFNQSVKEIFLQRLGNSKDIGIFIVFICQSSWISDSWGQMDLYSSDLGVPMFQEFQKCSFRPPYGNTAQSQVKVLVCHRLNDYMAFESYASLKYAQMLGLL